jgi:hypothetical protein
MRRTKQRCVYNHSPVVKDSDYAEFEKRCKDQLEKWGRKPTNKKIPILGTRPLDKASSRGTYLSKLRCFADFLMANPEYDESLVLLYAYTPKGTVTCEETAVANFLLSKFGEKGSPLLDSEVSII